MIINCDGGSRGNPGPAAIGIIIRKADKIIETYGEKIGKATNNVAEYSALIKSLELAKKHGKKIIIVMDSELVIRQMKGEYKVKSPDLKPLYDRAKKLETDFDYVRYEHVRREDKFQSKADKLVNDALDE